MVLLASLCKPVIHKLNILGGGKLQYHKPMRETTKKGWGANFEISVGGTKEGNSIFDSNLLGVNILEEAMVYFSKNLHQKYIYELYLNKTNTVYTTIIHEN